MWWAILALSVATGILFVPVMWALYRALEGVDRNAMLAGTGPYLGMVTGVLGVIAVVGPLVVDAADAVVILTSILTTVWVLLVGYKLLSPATLPAPTA